MIIDNVGFDVSAMAKLKVNEFVKIHMDNDAICRNVSEVGKTKWLKMAHAAIIIINDNTIIGGTDISKPEIQD
jgi:hypothetical protein